MDPHQVAERKFVVHNEGTGPLRFLDHRSDCKCTVGDFPRDPVLPGESAEITIQWKTQANNERFEHSATVETNDPNAPSLTFTIRGNVLVHVGADPPQFALPSVRPGVSTEAATLISSQVWESLSVTDISSSLDGVTWELAPAKAEELAALRARSGQRLVVRLPDDLPQGPFTHEIRFRAAPVDGLAEPREYRMPITGKVLRRLAVYGPGIDSSGRIAMGVIQSSAGHQHRLIVKVYDPEPHLEVQRVQVLPDFLQVRLVPHADEQESKGIYRLEIDVPPGTLPARFQASNAGVLKLDFDHPRIPDLMLRLDFAIASPAADVR
jgi:hypothetical protein